MSAFVCILDRSGADLDPRQVHRLAEPLEIYGATLSSHCQGPVAIAIRHAVDPAAGGLHGPVTDAASGLVAAVAGRFAQVDEPPAAASTGRRAARAGAATALDAILRRDAGFLAGLAGSFVLIAADPGQPWLSVARDHLGSLKVYYYLDRRWLIAASEPAVILRHAAVAQDVDEVAAARYLGFRFSQGERSFFRHIQELPPAHQLRVTAGDYKAEQYWRFRLLPSLRNRSRERILAGFRAHLTRSALDQVTGLEPEQVALSLSGGLDSTTLAALAPDGVRAFSWTFDDAPECDERGNIAAVGAHLGKPIHWVKGDGLYPLCGDFVDSFVHQGSPHVNAFAALKRRLYRAARAEGCVRILLGDCGDALYSAEKYWLRDALTLGAPGVAASLLRTIREAARGDSAARLALRRLVPVTRIRSTRRGTLPWLTEAAQSLLPPTAFSPILPEARRQRRYELSVGAKHTELVSEEARLFAQCGIGFGDAYWHWPLLEMVINLPAWWLHQDGRSKVLTREAMKGLLPDRVLEGGRGGLMGSFFLRGIESRRPEIREAVFRHPRSDWQRYVERAWLEPYLEATGSIQFGHTILWRVISYELWQRRLIRSG